VVQKVGANRSTKPGDEFCHTARDEFTKQRKRARDRLRRRCWPTLRLGSGAGPRAILRPAPTKVKSELRSEKCKLRTDGGTHRRFALRVSHLPLSASHLDLPPWRPAAKPRTSERERTHKAPPCQRHNSTLSLSLRPGRRDRLRRPVFPSALTYGNPTPLLRFVGLGSTPDPEHAPIRINSQGFSKRVSPELAAHRRPRKSTVHRQRSN
jgi:hypothetical protein